MSPLIINARQRFRGVAEIVVFNWHWYFVAGVFITIVALTLTFVPAPAALRLTGVITCAAALSWGIASLVVSHWVYDLSELRRQQWIVEALPTAPLLWCNLHCGLDESSTALRELFGEAGGTVLDVFDGDEMTEQSIARARARSRFSGRPANFRHLPVPSGSQDAVFLLFAAHELRGPASREELFREVRRILRDNGSVIIAEHLRDVPNICAFGPGAWHFFPRREWLRVFSSAALHVAREFRITPFVRIFVLRRAP